MSNNNNNEMEMAFEVSNSADIREKGKVSALPKIKKAIIGRADINSYGRNENYGKMVGGKFQIMVILGEDWNGFKKGEKTTANAILYKAGVKTFAVFSEFEKAKAACKKVSKWGKAVVEKKERTSLKAEIEALKKAKADLEQQLRLAKAAVA